MLATRMSVAGQDGLEMTRVAQEAYYPWTSHSIRVCANVIAPAGASALLGTDGVDPWSKPLGIAISSSRGGEIDKTASAPVAGRGEENEEQEGAVDAGPIEEVGCHEEEGQVKWGERERKGEQEERNVAGKDMWSVDRKRLRMQVCVPAQAVHHCNREVGRWGGTAGEACSEGGR